jgi:phosphopantetheinyl transferase
VAWLGQAEREVYDDLRDRGRREAWLFGRLLAKELILADLAGRSPTTRWDPAEIEIHSRDGLGRPIRPRVVVGGQLQPWSLSIAHSDTTVLLALTRQSAVSVGVDLASPVAAAARGLGSWFTPAERRWLDQCPADGRDGPIWPAGRAWRAAVVWAAKEAGYKAIGATEGFSPGRIEVQPGRDGACLVTIDQPGQRTRCRVDIGSAGDEVAAVATVTRNGPGPSISP